MDENEFLNTLDDVNRTPCTFAKAIFRRCCGCSLSEKLLLAEREILACLSPGDQQRCESVIPVLRDKAMFALKMVQIDGKLPHGKEVKVQCGALLALDQQLHLLDELPSYVEDIDALLKQAVAQYGSIESFPFSEMVQAIHHFKVRG